MKKKFLAMITLVLLISSIAGFASAAGASTEMHNAIAEAKKEQFSNMKAGSLKLTDVQEVSVSVPGLETGTIQMALAEYTTVRDSIFPTVRKEVVFFDPENNEVVYAEQLGAIQEIDAYKQSHDGNVGAKLQMGLIIVLLIVVPILVVLLIVLIWEPRQYSVTKFKIANRLFHNQNETFS